MSSCPSAVLLMGPCWLTPFPSPVPACVPADVSPSVSLAPRSLVLSVLPVRVSAMLMMTRRSLMPWTSPWRMMPQTRTLTWRWRSGPQHTQPLSTQHAAPQHAAAGQEANAALARTCSCLAPQTPSVVNAVNHALASAGCHIASGFMYLVLPGVVDQPVRARVSDMFGSMKACRHGLSNMCHQEPDVLCRGGGGGAAGW